MPKSFAPIVAPESCVLVIGTMPGEASLSAGEYYAHPRNAFWHIIADIFNQGIPFADFSAKKACLLKHKIGLWDSLQFCERHGSLDSNIRKEKPNNFTKLLKQYPQIKTLLFNGNQAFTFFKKYHAPLLDETSYHILPSTSPANARLSYEQKRELWQQAFQKSLQEISA